MASPDKKSFLLRVDPALWTAIERLAASELRSANAQVEYLLREALAKRGIGSDDAAASQVDRAPQTGLTHADVAPASCYHGDFAAATGARHVRIRIHPIHR